VQKGKICSKNNKNSLSHTKISPINAVIGTKTFNTSKNDQPVQSLKSLKPSLSA
jgi:hypothetical protein